jgi:hypothetical protein
MEAETVHDTVSAGELQARLAEAREHLDELARALVGIDAELDMLATARKQHGFLQSACDALKGLEQIGGTDLFWGSDTPPETRAGYLREAQSRIATFEKRVGEVADRRRSLIEEMNEHHRETELLEEDAFDAQEEEERLRNEWIVEREIDAIRSRASVMPWARGGEDDRRFRKNVTVALLVSVLFALILPLIHLPLPRLVDEPAPLPDRAVTMVAEAQPRPPPPPIETKPKERLVQEKRIEKPVPQPSATQPPEPVKEPEQEQGLLAFREKLAAFKDVPVVAQLGSQARIKSDDGARRPDRSMLTTNAPGSSGGIKLAALSRSLGTGAGDERGAIQGAALTRASSAINAVGPASRPLSGGPGLARTDEEIQIVFDRYKAALYRLYNRELRRDPTLQGKMILRLTIEPNGRVSFCALQSTDMNAPDLSAQVVDRVRTFDFGAKEVPAITIVYPIDFLPAA